MAKLITTAAVRKFALRVAEQKRPGRFTRVSQDFLDKIEQELVQIIHNKVHRHPSVGKTLID